LSALTGHNSLNRAEELRQQSPLSENILSLVHSEPVASATVYSFIALD